MAWRHGHGGRRPFFGATLDTCTDNDDDDGTFITPHYSNNFPAARPSSSRHWTCTAPHPHRSARCARSRSPSAKPTVSFFLRLHVLFLSVEANIAQHSNTQSRFNSTVLEYCAQVTSYYHRIADRFLSLYRSGIRAYSIVRQLRFARAHSY
jgi:hypothetical protein